MATQALTIATRNELVEVGFQPIKKFLYNRKHASITTDAIKRARHIIRQAQKQAEEIKNEANNDSAQVASIAREQGIEAGRAKIVETQVELLAMKKRLYKEAIDEMHNVVFEIVAEIVGAELKSNRGSIVNRISEAIQNLAESKKVTIAINPADYVAVSNELVSIYKDAKQDVQIVSDKNMPEGCARLDSELGSIEASPWLHLESIKRVLAPVVLWENPAEN